MENEVVFIFVSLKVLSWDYFSVSTIELFVRTTTSSPYYPITTFLLLKFILSFLMIRHFIFNYQSWIKPFAQTNFLLRGLLIYQIRGFSRYYIFSFLVFKLKFIFFNYRFLILIYKLFLSFLFYSLPFHSLFFQTTFFVHRVYFFLE